MSKFCNVCKETKEFSEFGKSGSMKDGLKSKCKSCTNEEQIIKRRTKKGLVGEIYSGQKHKSKERGHIPPSYTLYGLRQWFKSNAAANALYDAWVLSDYAKNLRPSVDRLDDSKGYSLDNIQLMTWGENMAKSHADVKSGRMKKCRNKAVIQMDLDGNFVAEYHSAAEACRITGADGTTIRCCCNPANRHKTAGNFKWKYKEES